MRDFPVLTPGRGSGRCRNSFGTVDRQAHAYAEAEHPVGRDVASPPLQSTARAIGVYLFAQGAVAKRRPRSPWP